MPGPAPVEPFRQPLSVIDRLVFEMVRRSTDTALHLGLVMMFDGPPPSREQLVEQLAARLPYTPELTFRMGGDPRRPVWENDPDFELGNHLHQLTLATAAEGDDPDRVLTALHGEPISRTHPLWGIWWVRGERGYAIGYKAHHAFQDGLAAVETCERLFGPEPREASPPPPAARPSLLEKLNTLRQMVVKDLLPSLRRNVPWVGSAHPASGRRVALTAAVELSRLHALGRATGASVNQVCVAAVAGVVRAWHPEHWAGRDGGLRAMMAINVRDPQVPYRLLGNYAGVASLFLPCAEAAPLARLASARVEASYARLAGVGRRHRMLFQKVPYWAGVLGTNQIVDPRYNSLALADVRLRRPLRFAGTAARSTHLLPVAVPNQLLFTAWTTHQGRLYVTFLVDTGVGGHERLPQAWLTALAELEGAVRRSAADGSG